MPPRGKPAEEQPTTEVLEPEQTETGDGGAREAEVTAAQEQFDAMKDTLDLGERSGDIVRNASHFVLDLFKHRPKAWDQLSRDEQRDLGTGIEENVHELVRQIVEAVVAAKADPVRCLFVGFTDKGDDIKAELKLKAYSKEETEAAVLFFHRARGHHVLVQLASADEFHAEPADDRSEPDQRGLEFESGSDEVPDLEAAAEVPVEVEDQLLRDGDAVFFAGGEGRVRIDLKRGWVQFIEEGEVDLEGNWQDMREATPSELAAERERTADFGGDEAEEAPQPETVEE